MHLRASWQAKSQRRRRNVHDSPARPCLDRGLVAGALRRNGHLDRYRRRPDRGARALPGRRDSSSRLTCIAFALKTTKRTKTSSHRRLCHHAMRRRHAVRRRGCRDSNNSSSNNSRNESRLNHVHTRRHRRHRVRRRRRLVLPRRSRARRRLSTTMTNPTMTPLQRPMPF